VRFWHTKGASHGKGGRKGDDNKTNGGGFRGGKNGVQQSASSSSGPYSGGKGATYYYRSFTYFPNFISFASLFRRGRRSRAVQRRTTNKLSAALQITTFSPRGRSSCINFNIAIEIFRSERSKGGATSGPESVNRVLENQTLESQELTKKKTQKIENEKKRRQLQQACTEKMKLVMAKMKQPGITEVAEEKYKAVMRIITHIY
jgi:hypothetical protein